MKFAFCFAVQLVDVVSERVEDGLCENIVRAASCKSFETIILFKNPKRPLGLYATVKA